MEFHATADDWVAVYEPSEPGSDTGIAYLSVHGLYDLSVVALDAGETDPGTELSISYSDPPEALPVPETGGAWLGTMRTVFPDGHVQDQTAAYAFGEGGPRTLDGCDYATVPVKVSFLDGDNWEAQQFIYFSDLGIAVPTVLQISDEPRPQGRALASVAKMTK